jgi:DNA-binding MarR family transcriptional regulator
MENPREVFLMQQTYATLFSLANKLQVRGDQYMKRLTSRQFMAMLAIIHLSEDSVSLNNIARMLGTTKQNVKQLITIIEKKGYVITVPNQQDRRAVNIKITESGRQVMIESNEMGMKFFADLFNEFTIEEMEVLWSLLKKLYRFDGQEQAGLEEEIAFS